MKTDPITRAEREIAAILEKLEAETDMVLASITVRDIEVTTLGDERTQWSRKACIEMYRLPGTRWEK